MIEKDIEKYLISQIKKTGGLTWKLTSPSTSGVPDRLVIRQGKCWFVELKRPKGSLRKLQKYRSSELQKQGFDVICLDTKNKVDQFIEYMERGEGL